jgi:spermidine synthase
LESSLYTDDVVFAKQSKYQRIVVTKWKNIFRLFLDGNIQFSSTDEYRYHEALVHPPMLAARKRENIAVLGGGDGMAVRELLRYPEVKSIQLVDLDPAITDLASTNPDFRSLNKDSLIDPKVRVINQDARQFLKEWQGEAFDVIIVDFPDPNNESLSKLYTRQFYQLLKQRLAAFGAVSIQSTSPLYARDAFWMINRTVEAADLHVYPYHTYVPSFGEWGFQLVGHHPIDVKNIKLIPTMKFKFLTQETLTALFTLPVDLTESGQGINSIENGNLLRVYMEGWEFWN